MTDYTSMKVPELKKLLAEKKLAQTGNKADLIARLQEEDNKADATPEDAKPGTLSQRTYNKAELTLQQLKQRKMKSTTVTTKPRSPPLLSPLPLPRQTPPPRPPSQLKVMMHLLPKLPLPSLLPRLPWVSTQAP